LNLLYKLFKKKKTIKKE